MKPAVEAANVALNASCKGWPLDYCVNQAHSCPCNTCDCEFGRSLSVAFEALLDASTLVITAFSIILDSIIYHRLTVATFKNPFLY